MGERTEIAWTDKTWNPWQGCRKVSAGCANCYMYRDKKRYGQDPATVVRSKPATFNAPLRWHPCDRSLVFTCSWSDFFIEEADAWRDEAWDIVRRTPHLTYQILTKRPERMEGRIPVPFLRNLWLGVTVEDRRARGRIDLLAQAPAALRFISCEPLVEDLGDLQLAGSGVDWVIVGGESGSHRLTQTQWVRSIVEQCRAARVPCFVKQMGTEWARGLANRNGADPAAWPEYLRVREFPVPAASRDPNAVQPASEPAAATGAPGAEASASAKKPASSPGASPEAREP